MLAPHHLLQVIEDFLLNSPRHLRVETIPTEHTLEVLGEFLLEARLLECVTNECTCVPLIEAEFDLVVNMRGRPQMPDMQRAHHSH